MSEQNEEKFNICKWWLARGFALLPVQPNKKYLVQGYGEHKKKIVTTIEARELIEKYPSANLAVFGHGGTIILDFDSPELYNVWKSSHAEMSNTYTERTPRGGAHVFLFGSAPGGLILNDGVELKKICLVCPSTIGADQYTRGAGEIIEANEFVFSSLSKPGTKSGYVLSIEERKRERMPYGKSGLVDQIKQSHDILQVFALYRPEFKPEKRLPYYTVICPFHEDHKPSMYLDGVRQLYKCHACGARGDVINLYAHFEKISTREAIARMAVSLRAVQS